MSIINMKQIRYSNQLVWVCFLITALLTACWESTSKDEGVTRVLNNSPINGVTYDCDGKKNLTQNGGEFKCVTTPVTFSIGGLTLGQITVFNSDKQVFPQDLSSVDSSNFSDAKTIKLARFLQSIDDDGDISKAIDIPSLVTGKFLANSNIDDFTLDQLASMVSVDLVTKPFEISHLKRSLSGAP